MDDLLVWKNTRNRKPAMIRGPRQCGKTWVMKELGKTYPDCAYFNLEDDDISWIFDKDLKVDRIVKALGVHRSAPISKDTLIIIDEIQLCSRAITSLKYFCEDGRYDVICAGSLLGVKLMETSPPVGKVDDFDMYPMSFEEFAIASGEGMLVELLSEDPFDPVSGFRDRLIRLYNEYLAVGGLPEAVASWTADHDTEEVERILRALSSRYVDDIMRYGDRNVRANGESVWRSVPSQLARDNNRFVFGHVREGSRARDLWLSVDWLERAGLVYLVPISMGREEPPSFTSDRSSFKLYCFDTGIMRVLSDIPMRMALEGFAGMDLYRGAVTENYVMSELRRMTVHDISCWRSGNKAEVDFITRFDGPLVPIEVKAGTKVRARGLGVFLDQYGGDGVVVSMNPLSFGDRALMMPLYQLWTLPKVLEGRPEPPGSSSEAQ